MARCKFLKFKAKFQAETALKFQPPKRVKFNDQISLNLAHGSQAVPFGRKFQIRRNICLWCIKFYLSAQRNFKIFITLVNHDFKTQYSPLAPACRSRTVCAVSLAASHANGPLLKALNARRFTPHTYPPLASRCIRKGGKF